MQLPPEFHPDMLNPLSAGFDPGNPYWVKLSMEERMQMMHLAQMEAVEERGYTCVGVFPTEEVDDDNYHFAYTVGLPVSVIATGVSQSGQTVLDMAAPLVEMQRPGVPWEAQDGFYMVFAPVPDVKFREHCTQAIAHGAKSAVQVIWQDGGNRWPWHPDHLHQEIGGAPVLAGDDWRPGHD